MAKKAKPKKVRITLVRSTIGERPVHGRTVRALGLHRIRHSVEQEWNPTIQGMVKAVSHLVEYEEIG